MIYLLIMLLASFLGAVICKFLFKNKINVLNVTLIYFLINLSVKEIKSNLPISNEILGYTVSVIIACIILLLTKIEIFED